MKIMKLVPTGKDYLWGGIRLREEYGKKIDLTPLAETWECSVHPDGPSYIANGEFKGLALAEGMHYKKPAVTFTIPGSGVNYVSLNGVTGIEVENRNIEKYADAMRTLAQSENLRLKYGKAGKERVENKFLSTQFSNNIQNLVRCIER